MLTQYKKCTLITLGKPKSIIRDLDVSDIKDTMTEEHQKRVESAIEDDFYVYPKSQSLYRVQSIEDNEVKDVYTVNLKSSDSCSCRDFLFNGHSNGVLCKHIWRTKFLIQLGCLPDESSNPYTWFVNELHKDIKWIKSTVQSKETIEYISEISEIKSGISQEDRLNYKIHLDKRLRVLMDAKAEGV